jgi:hypothetical protein
MVELEKLPWAVQASTQKFDDFEATSTSSQFTLNHFVGESIYRSM